MKNKTKNIKVKVMDLFTKENSMEKLINVVSGAVIMLTSIYLYQHGYQNNLIIAAGIFGLFKMA